MKLNPEVKAKWLAALRSGDYTQGRKQLKTPAGDYDCIGVLCDISGMGEWSPEADEDGGSSYLVRYNNETYRAWATAPLPVRDWAVETHDMGEEWEALVKLNDHNRLSFEEIATYIEAHL